MNVPELLEQLRRMYPGQLATAEQTEAWLPTFRSALGRVEPADLQRAFDAVMARWTNTRAFPMPAEFAKELTKAGPALPQGMTFAERMAKRDEERRERSRQIAEMGWHDFRQRHGLPEWKWHAWWRISRLADDYAQAEELHKAGRLSDLGFAKYRYKLTDDECDIARKCWESQRGGKNNLPFAEPVNPGCAARMAMEG